ncbi:MAG: hypothetical protein Q9170_002271 [Blastenia crenularia]
MPDSVQDAGHTGSTVIDPAGDSLERLYTEFLGWESAAQPPLAQDKSDERVSNNDVLRLIPLNTEARRAFDSVARLEKDGKLQQIHAQYLQVTGSGPLNRGIDVAVHHSDETTDEALSDHQSQPDIYEGYFKVGFHLSTVLNRPAWAMGQGSAKKHGPSRSVDILLAAPRSREAHGLAATHAFLNIHRESGVWVLSAGEKMEAEDQIMQPKKKFALHQPKTRIQILDMQYLIRFMIETPDQERSYLEERNRIFAEQDRPLPHTNISGIPLPSTIVLESIVFRHGLGSGTFGDVYEGFHPGNGDLRVVKRIVLQSTKEIPIVKQEIEALKRFDGRQGILKLLDWRTALNGQELLVSQYPLDVYLVHEKGIAFHRYDWEAVADDWGLKQSLCHQLLKGLTEIHRAGCMHRDITPQNILFFPYEEHPQARLCDFGKFCDTSTAVDTALAGWKFLPPELEKDKLNTYGQGLDIWELGLALTYCWWPKTTNLRPREKPEYERMQKMLWGDTEGDGLGHLVARMMEWNPRKRLSAAQALQHRSVRTVANEKPPVKTSSSKRLHDDER